MRFIHMIREIFDFLGARKKWWLFPVVLFLAALGGLMVISAGSPIAPFIYTLF